MAQEDKSLLLRDLSARLPYNVKVDITYSKEHGSSDRLQICSEGCLTLNTDLLDLYIQDEIYLKPYLRPMSSMTEDEWTKYENMCDSFRGEGHYKLIDWLNSRHLDYRGLIGKGLALKAKENMYIL